MKLKLYDKEYPLKELNSLGRGSHNSVQVISPLISRSHALVYQEQDQWFVEDLNSQNGTRVNDRPVLLKAPLRVGDRLTLGNIPLTVEE